MACSVSQHHTVYVFQLIVFQPSQIAAAVLEFVLEISPRNVRVRQASWKPLLVAHGSAPIPC
jgi:hypothetical protein